MVQVDLITGFLGAGKTTFLRRYAAYLTAQGHHVCILENDFGAVNVDAMLVQDLLGGTLRDRRPSAVIVIPTSAGCAPSSSQWPCAGSTGWWWSPAAFLMWTSFLMSCGMSRWIGGIHWAMCLPLWMPSARTLSPQAEYILASEAASAGRILLSRSQLATQAQREGAIDHLKRALAACKVQPHPDGRGFSDQGLGRPGGWRSCGAGCLRLSAYRLRKALL